METARNELYDLSDSQTPQGAQPQGENLTKDDVVSAIHEYSSYQQQALEKAEQDDRARRIQQKRSEEQQALQEASESVKTSLKEEMSQNKDFAKLVQSSDLPGALIDYIAEVGEAEEAPLIVRELAHNDEYKEALKRSKTQVGVKRLIGKIRKDVLTGGSQGRVPSMLKKSIPNYDYNTNSSSAGQDYYSDLAMRHGI